MPSAVVVVFSHHLGVLEKYYRRRAENRTPLALTAGGDPRGATRIALCKNCTNNDISIVSNATPAASPNSIILEGYGK